MNHAVLVHDFTGFFLLVEHMRFHLIDHRSDLIELAKINEPVGIKIRHADCPEFSGAVGFFHGAPCAVIIAERLMYEQQVDVIGTQFSERLVDGFFRLFITGV